MDILATRIFAFVVTNPEDDDETEYGERRHDVVMKYRRAVKNKNMFAFSSHRIGPFKE